MMLIMFNDYGSDKKQPWINMCMTLCLCFQLTLTCPPPLSLLVSFTLLNEIGSFIQWAPKFGESGCT